MLLRYATLISEAIILRSRRAAARTAHSDEAPPHAARSVRVNPTAKSLAGRDGHRTPPKGPPRHAAGRLLALDRLQRFCHFRLSSVARRASASPNTSAISCVPVDYRRFDLYSLLMLLRHCRRVFALIFAQNKMFLRAHTRRR